MGFSAMKNIAKLLKKCCNLTIIRRQHSKAQLFRFLFFITNTLHNFYFNPQDLRGAPEIGLLCCKKYC